MPPVLCHIKGHKRKKGEEKGKEEIQMDDQFAYAEIE